MEPCARLRTHDPAPRRSGIVGVVITVVTWKLAHCPLPCTATRNRFDFDNPCSHAIETREIAPRAPVSRMRLRSCQSAAFSSSVNAADVASASFQGSSTISGHTTKPKSMWST